MDWSIQARSHQCQQCGRGFRHREPLHTLLRDERHAYHRVDVCEACWTAHYAEGANHQRGFVSCWKTRYATPPPPPPEPIQRASAENLLRKLVEQNAPEHAAACFILAVMLERKRLLKVKSQTVEGDRRWLVYEHSKTGDIFTIPDPHLQLDQLDAVRRDVAHLLEHGLDAAAPPSCPTESAAPAPSAFDGPDHPVETDGRASSAPRPLAPGDGVAAAS